MADVGKAVGREPRDWRKYWHSYLGHALQGVAFGLVPVVSIVMLWWSYLEYQKVEYRRFKDRRDSEVAGIPILLEWPSRDIADMMLGGWIGIGLQLAAVLAFVILYVT